METERRDCPYWWCSAIVEVTPVIPPGKKRNGGLPLDARDGGPDRGLIRLHDIVSVFLKGTCPASLMYFPLDSASYLYLSETKYNSDMAKIEIAKRYQEAHTEKPFPPQNKSQNLRQPGRMGREPPDDAPEWVLGGREDEDVRSEREDVVGPVPASTAGFSLGRSSGMASITELAGMANAAGVSGNEAHAALNSAIDALDEATRIYMAILGDADSGRIRDAITHIRNAKSKCIEAKGAIENAAEEGSQFVQNLFA